MKTTAEQPLSRMFMYTGTAVNDIIPLSNAHQGDANFEKLLEAAHNTVRMLLAIFASPSPDPDSFAGIRDFSTVSLVYFRGFFEGTIGSEVNRIVQIPLYFQEVKVYRESNRMTLEQAELLCMQIRTFGTDAIADSTDEVDIAVLQSLHHQLA